MEKNEINVGVVDVFLASRGRGRPCYFVQLVTRRGKPSKWARAGFSNFVINLKTRCVD